MDEFRRLEQESLGILKDAMQCLEVSLNGTDYIDTIKITDIMIKSLNNIKTINIERKEEVKRKIFELENGNKKIEPTVPKEEPKKKEVKRNPQKETKIKISRGVRKKK